MTRLAPSFAYGRARARPPIVCDAQPLEPCDCACGRNHLRDRSTLVRRDPTQTLDLRNAFGRVLDKKWNGVAKLLTQALYKEDRWGLGMMSSNSIGLIQASGSHVQAFQAWFDTLLNEVVLGYDRELWIGHFIAKAFERGWQRSEIIVGESYPVAYDRAAVLVALTVTEFQGVMEAVSQQAVRAFSNGLVHRTRPRKIAADIVDRIRKIGRVRSRATTSNMIVRAHAEASLDVFELAHVEQVGIVPERIKKVQEQVQDTPSARTVRRIRRGERKLQRLKMVEVLTAGDDDVCQTCQDIAEDGPYTVSEARGQIPAHPECRCAFIPWFDLRFSDALLRDEWNEAEHPRDPMGQFTNSMASLMRMDPVEASKLQRELLERIRRKKAAEQTNEPYEGV